MERTFSTQNAKFHDQDPKEEAMLACHTRVFFSHAPVVILQAGGQSLLASVHNLRIFVTFK